ncbi:phosphotransferase family protein [Streptomyces xiangluensis]|uniref:Phosphotransferase family protein n=1 Tax=Streptomyces xiangluensis TaxID=2665720 RepID=A0ABV8YNX8_9ACTN
MNNLHRRQLDREQLEGILTAAGTDPGEVDSVTELTDATFNTVYRVRLRDSAAGRPHRGLVLKIAPDPHAPTLTYERGIMRTEALFYRATAGRAPVPDVVHADFTRDVAGSDVLVLTDLPGTNWYAAREQLADGERAGLRTELGGMVAALHQVTGAGFGYPQMSLAPDWRTAFLSMVDTVLTDADAFAAPLPMPATRIRETVWGSADLLDAVRTAVLVHFDLWEGNILVDRAAGQPRIGGLVDGERAFWGDPLADLVSLALFDDIERDEPFLSGYRSAGGRIDFDSATRRRLAMYRCYLYLIMLVEPVPRGFSGPDHERQTRYVSRRLRAELANISPTVRQGGGL